MIVRNKKTLKKGLLLLGGFFTLLVLMFMPIDRGSTPVHDLDVLYNRISKGSVYYIDQLQQESEQLRGTTLEFRRETDTPRQAEQVSALITAAGGRTVVNGNTVIVNSELRTLLQSMLADADTMFHNNGAELRERYNLPEKHVLYEWWQTLKAMEQSLTREERYDEAKFVHSVMTKGVECAYNYYGIEAGKISEEALLVIASLVFYVIYTVWFGYAILFLLQGLGLKIEH